MNDLRLTECTAGAVHYGTVTSQHKMYSRQVHSLQLYEHFTLRIARSTQKFTLDIILS